jgi:hypothetical protein
MVDATRVKTATVVMIRGPVRLFMDCSLSRRNVKGATV